MTDRERFEAWVPPSMHLHQILCAWEAWQAAAAEAEQDKWAAVRACVDTINCYSYVGDRSKEMLVAIKAEFPEAFK